MLLYWFKCCHCTTSSIFSVLSNNTQQYIIGFARNANNTQHLFSCFSASLIQSIGEFGAKNILQTIEQLIQFSYLLQKRSFYGSLLFQNKSQRREIPQVLRNKYSHLLICISLKLTLVVNKSLSFKVCQNTIKILISEQVAFAAVLFFRQVFVFCRLSNKSMLDCFLLIMCK